MQRVLPDTRLISEGVDRLAEGPATKPALAVALLGACLFLPFLGSFGLWDPVEVRVAEVAREMAHAHSWVVPAHGGAKPPFLYWALTVGYRFLGNGEWAGRLPVALLSIAALLAAFYAGSGLLKRRAALLGTVALATSPAFFLGARQLTTLVGPILGTTLAIGGLARAAWPRSGVGGGGKIAPFVHLGLGFVGLFIGFFSTGAVLGVLVPVASVALALLLTGAGSDQPGRRADATLARVVFSTATLALIAVATVTFYRSMLGGAHAGYTPILAGTPHAAQHSVEYVTLLKQIGFGAFPWIALLPLGAGRIFAAFDGPSATDPEISIASDGQGPATSRETFGRLVLLVWVLTAYLAATLYAASIADLGFAGYAAIALLSGFVVDALWDERGESHYTGLVALVGAVVIVHDYFIAPESWAGAHVQEGIKWPGPLTAQPWFILIAGLLWAAIFALACLARTASAAAEDAATPEGSDGSLESVAAGGETAPARFAHPGSHSDGRKTLLVASLAVALGIALGTTYWVIPAVSQHLSYKGLYTKFKSLVGTGNAAIGKYHVPGQLSEYGNSTELASLPAMFEFLGKSERVFVIAAADDLASIDQYAKSRGSEAPGAVGAGAKTQNTTAVNYYVIDDSNSKFLMISNQLGKEPDLNPLRRLVIKADPANPPKPQHEVHADFEGKVELVGYDLPLELERGHQFKIKLYFKVNQPLNSSYKVFVHFDGPGSRFNGDHVPLEGRFPTNNWVPGFYVLDEHTMEPERATAPAGYYQIYAGFWMGDSRLKVVSGPQDGEQRVKLGAVRVK